MKSFQRTNVWCSIFSNYNEKKKYYSRSKYAFCEDNETDDIMKHHDDDDEHNTLNLERMENMLVRWITRYLHRGESSSAKQQCILISSFRLTMNISNGDHALEDDNIMEILTVTLVIRHQVGKTL